MWGRAAFAPAWDAFELFGTVLGLALTAWRLLFPGNFTWAAKLVGLTAEAAMSDAVLVFAVVLGGCVFAYRIIRAPYEIHLRDADESKRRIQSAISQNSKEVKFTIRSSQLAPSTQGMKLRYSPEIFLVFPGVQLLNPDTEPTVVAFTLQLHMGGHVSMQIYPVPTIPTHVVATVTKASSESVRQCFNRTLQIGKRDFLEGWLAFVLDTNTLKDIDVAAVDGRQLSLIAENVVSGESVIWNLPGIVGHLARKRGVSIPNASVL